VLQHAANRTRDAELLARLAEGPDSRAVERQLLAKDGTPVWLHLTLNSLFDQHGAFTGQITVTLDLRERKRHEAALRHYTRQLETLRALDQAILEQRPERELMAMALSQVRHVLGCQRAAVIAYHAEQRQLVVVAMESATPTQVGVGHVTGPISDAQLAKMIASTRKYPRFHKQRDRSRTTQLLIAEGIQSMVRTPIQARGELIGILSVGATTPDAFDSADTTLLERVADLLAIGIIKTRLRVAEEAAQRTAERLRAAAHALTQRLVQVQEQERRHLARELHDEIGQTLTGAGMLLRLVPTLEEPQRRGAIDRISNLLQELIERVRNLSLELRPGVLDDHGLVPALRWLLRRYQERSLIDVQLTVSGGQRRLSNDVETTVYRITQEALTNIARYAEVRAACVELRITASQLDLRISDTGKGFDLDQQRTRETVGLASMRERAALVGGTLTIVTAPGHGTQISTCIPLNAHAAAAG
jgi:signal transduction histidine kinase